jgi:hypothetical protein
MIGEYMKETLVVVVAAAVVVVVAAAAAAVIITVNSMEQKLIVTQLVNNLPAFYGIRNFISFHRGQPLAPILNQFGVPV